MDDHLLLCIRGGGAKVTFVRWSSLQLELRGKLVVEMLSYLVFVKIKLPPERLGGAQVARVENLSAGATQTQGRLCKKE